MERPAVKFTMAQKLEMMRVTRPISDEERSQAQHCFNSMLITEHALDFLMKKVNVQISLNFLERFKLPFAAKHGIHEAQLVIALVDLRYDGVEAIEDDGEEPVSEI